MARTSKPPVHHVQMTDGKHAIIQQLLNEYEINTSEYIQNALKDLLGDTLKEMMETEMSNHLGYGKSQRTEQSIDINYRNGTKSKQINSSFDSMSIDVPQDRKEFAADLKHICTAPNEKRAEEIRDSVMEKWEDGYPNSMKSRKVHWDAITPIFKFSSSVRSVIYTTNAIESLNATYRKLNSQRSVFPSEQALLKALWLVTFETTKKWSMPIRNFGKVHGEMSIKYERRLM